MNLYSEGLKRLVRLPKRDGHLGQVYAALPSLVLALAVAAGGLLIARIEGWPALRGVRWALMAAATVGGEAPSTPLGRAVAVPLGFCSVVLLVGPLKFCSNALWGEPLITPLLDFIRMIALPRLSFPSVASLH